MQSADYLVVGGGYAGDAAAAGLRKAGATGRVLMVSAEREYPYYRYTLSKEFILGKRQKARVYLHPPKFYEDQSIEVMLGTRAVALDVQKKLVTLDTGEELAFDKLLLATGAAPRVLPLPGSELGGVYYLRSLADSEVIRAEAVAGRRAVIIGGGFIGTELAASLTILGVKVTIVDVVETIWAHLFGKDLGGFFHEGLQKRGVSLLTPVHVHRIEGEGRVQRVITQEGHVLPCDFVVVGVGVRPEARLAELGGLQVDNGIVVDEYLETSARGVFAAGDNARFYSPVFGARMRIEHWEVAGQQGGTAALNMLGQRKPYDQVPYFFSGLFDLWLEFVGHAPQWDRLVVRRHGPEKFTAFYCQGPQVRGALLVNNSRELKLCRDMVQRRAPVSDLTALEDPGNDLAALARP